MSRYPLFDRGQLQLRCLSDRGSDMTIERLMPLAPPTSSSEHPEWDELLRAIVTARRADRPVIVMMGGHPIKLGLSRFLVDLMERELITHLATNGAGIIHDFELATAGGTSENVAKWIQAGQFGLWQETSRLNDIIVEAAKRDEGLGEAVGRVIEEEQLPNRRVSIAATGYRLGIPVTSHVSIGSDIIHATQNCDGAALGKASYTDFLIFARAIQDLEGGVFLNVGSAVTGPEVYLKALSMARNVHRQEESDNGVRDNGTSPLPRRFTTAVFDLVNLPDNFRDGPPGKMHPLYYYRPWKTILCRTIADGGSSYYFQGDHQQTIPTLWCELLKRTDPESIERLEQEAVT
ncbi:MAG: hypothetical protein H8E66_33875 [Planctomycetes bacterium]|nr:hypothetical protein [Planctomycetota bacterium]